MPNTAAAESVLLAKYVYAYKTSDSGLQRLLKYFSTIKKNNFQAGRHKNKDSR